MAHPAAKGDSAASKPAGQAEPVIIIFDSKRDENTEVRRERIRKETSPLAFINVTKSGQPAPGTRKLIRTHVMSDYWRKKVSKKGHCHPAEITTQDLNSASKVAQPGDIISLLCQPLGKLDTFARFSIEIKPYMHDILQQYMFQIGHERCVRSEAHEAALAECPRLAWLRMGLRDAAVMRALLCTTALHIDVTNGRGFSTRRYALKRDAIRTISDRLSDGSFVSDETITAVTLMAIDELQGVGVNTEHWNCHMRGLQRLVEIRGGLSKLPKELQCLIHVADLHGCDGILTKLYFPWMKESISQHQLDGSSRSPELEDNIKLNTALDSFDDHLLSSLHVVQSLTAAINRADENETEIDPYVVEGAAVYIQSRLSAASMIEREPMDQPIYATCSLGILIYLSTIVNQSVQQDLSQFELISMLKDSLVNIDFKAMLSPFIPWSVFFGRMAAQNTTHRRWFVTSLREATQILSAGDWQTLKSALKCLSWVEKQHDELGQLIWKAN